MVGNKDGTVTVWSGKSGNPICKYNNYYYIDVIKAHNTDITKL